MQLYDFELTLIFHSKMGFVKENVAVDGYNFWNGIKIYCEKPNSINKEVLYSEVIFSLKTECDISGAECQLLCDRFYDLIFIENKDVQEIVGISGCMEKFQLSDNNKVLQDMNYNYILLRKLKPKKTDDFDRKFYEIGYFDTRKNEARFYSLFDKNSKSDCDSLVGRKNFDPFVIVKFNKVSVYHQNCCLIVEYDDNLGEKGCNWIKSVFLKKLRKLILPKNENKVTSVINFSNEINVINYYKLYDRLKLKYAKNLVENWSEVTDPKKFVFEDIAIATYLLLLWNNGEIPNENSEKQKFVDLGCGNGLLVYILNSEGHKGEGLDVKKRQIWNTYPSNVILKEEAVIPGPGSVYPGVDWLIGNHSDELTPWLPIMARRSGVRCQYFVLPCCPFQLNGHIYQRKNSGLSAYHDYIHYIRKISELCEFETCIDRLRIPSTKKICIIGRKKELSSEKLLFINGEIDSFIARESSKCDAGTNESDDSDRKNWIREFKVRQTTVPVRNCTRLPKDLINEILLNIANNLLKELNVIPIKRGNVIINWNQGRRLHLSELANLISKEQLKQLKNECKGLQTLIKNHHYVFNVSEGMVRFRNIEEMLKISESILQKDSKYKWKQRDCWFDINHPDGCPLSNEICSYRHREAAGGSINDWEPLKRKMSEHNFLVGFWKILECALETGKTEKRGIQGTVFELSKTGDVTWKIPGDAISIPLFSCETYEIVTRGPFLANLLRFGAYKGHVIEFRIETYKPDVGIIMIHEGLFYMTCKKLDDVRPDAPIELPFSLLPALEDSYFSDLSIVASNNKEFLAHTCILKLSAPEIDWAAKPTPLSGLPEEVVGTILHFLYAQCLPPELQENVAEQVILSAPNYPGLESLVSMCQSYIKNVTLKSQIIGLISDMHACAAQIIDHFSNRHSKHFISNPVKLCYAVKSSIREAAVAGSKVLLLCDLYNKKKDEISRKGGHEIIRYAKSRIPIFMGQIERFFQSIKSTFGNLLSSQRHELACYLVPEMETILDTAASLLLNAKAFLEVILADVKVEDESQCRIKMETLEQHMDRFLHKKELGRFRFLLHRITCVLINLQEKKESFKAMSGGNKIRSVARNLEHLTEMLPFFLLRLEEVADDLDDKLEWNESQFCFKVGTSKVSEIIKNLIVHKEPLQELMVELCDLVQRDAFTQSLVSLGLLDPSLGAAGNPAVEKIDQNSQWTPKQHGYTFNLTEFLCESPPPHRNRLSKAASQLLRTGQGADMVFEIITNEESDRAPDEAGGNSAEENAEAKKETQILKIQAHRVIIAARCDWFRRALLSGMQEDINRKIEVHNTSPYLFSVFLEYLYSGRLDCSSLAVEQISELLLLSDRYELDSLKQICERGLKPHLDDESVLYFFNMADQFNANILKSACVQFISQHPDVMMDSELFEELPNNLQTEIYDLVIWGRPRALYITSDRLSSPYSVAEIERMAANVHISSIRYVGEKHGKTIPSELGNRTEKLSVNTKSAISHESLTELRSSRDISRPEGEDLPLTHDSARLESAIEQLRDIVGPSGPRSQLVQVILAADYDINRALNFYFSSS